MPDGLLHDQYFMIAAPWAIALFAVGGYLLGSIPFGLVITRVAGLGDIRAIGSGNIGATNVLRTGRKDLALATLLLDAGKAGLAYWIAFFVSRSVDATIAANQGIDMPAAAYTTMLAGYAHSMGLVAGAAAFIGHCYPVWLKFKGGKGVATFMGLLFAAAWPVGLVWGATWLLVAFTARISSLAALVACVVAPAVAFLFSPGAFEWSYTLIPGYMMGPNSDTWIVTAALAILIFYRHKPNIARLLAGTEPRIGAGKTPAPDAPE